MRRSRRRELHLRLWGREHALSPRVEAPEDWPTRAELPTQGLRPLWHGDYSGGLSATFAAINALRLVSAGHCILSRRDEERLLARAWDWRKLREQLRPDRGLRQSDWRRMVEALCGSFARRHGQFIRVSQPWTTPPHGEEFYSTLERLIVGHSVVLTLFAGAHYSVVRGYTPTSLLLFDSGERYWMRRKSIVLVNSNAPGRHHVVPCSTLALSRSC